MIPGFTYEDVAAEAIKEFKSVFEDKALSMIIDENLLNLPLGYFTNLDRKYSLKDHFLKIHSSFMGVVNPYMNTDQIGLVLPPLNDEFGSNKKIDLLLTISQRSLGKYLNGLAPSGFTFDKNGKIKFNLNFGGSLLVQNEAGEYKEARTFEGAFVLEA